MSQDFQVGVPGDGVYDVTYIKYMYASLTLSVKTCLSSFSCLPGLLGLLGARQMSFEYVRILYLLFSIWTKILRYYSLVPLRPLYFSPRSAFLQLSTTISYSFLELTSSYFSTLAMPVKSTEKYKLLPDSSRLSLWSLAGPQQFVNVKDNCAKEDDVMDNTVAHKRPSFKC